MTNVKQFLSLTLILSTEYYYAKGVADNMEQNKILNKGSELRQVLSSEMFEKVYKAFILQADKNVISRKSCGGQAPMYFAEKPYCDGAYVSTHYGQGAASKTPYLCWWAVSIYYLPANENIYIGIEEDRYAHLNEMEIKPLEYLQLGNKNKNVAIYYSTSKRNIDYAELYNNFINVCEEVMRLGL